MTLGFPAHLTPYPLQASGHTPGTGVSGEELKVPAVGVHSLDLPGGLLRFLVVPSRRCADDRGQPVLVRRHANADVSSNEEELMLPPYIEAGAEAGLHPRDVCLVLEAPDPHHLKDVFNERVRRQKEEGGVPGYVLLDGEFNDLLRRNGGVVHVGLTAYGIPVIIPPWQVGVDDDVVDALWERRASLSLGFLLVLLY